MTVREETAAKINAHNTNISSIIQQKDADTLELASAVDRNKELNERNAEIITELTTAKNKAEKDLADHLALPHYPKPVEPPVVTPPAPTPTKRRTLHGLGGGNTVRTGIEVDRRYYAAGDKTKMINDTTTNEGKGILSVNSMKFPYAWDRMAKGDGDEWFKTIMKDVSEAIKPKLDDPDDVDEVWFSGHHEPEGDQPDERLWRDTQERLSLLVPGGSKGPVKFWLTTTGWNQEFNTAAVAALVDWGSLWPMSGDIYGIAYDAPYNTYGKIYKSGVATGEVNNKITDPNAYIDAVALRAKQFGVEAASFEWGYSDELFARDNGAWRDKVMDRCINNPIQQLLAEIYFDTRLNSSHSWYLGDGQTAKRKGHMAAMAARKGK